MGFEKGSFGNYKIFTVGSVSNAIQYGYTGQKSPKGKLFYVRITDIQDGKIDWPQVPFSDISEKEAPKYILSKGDILFARSGATAGKSYLFEDEKDAVFASYLIRIIPNQSKILPRFLYLYFQSDSYWGQINDKVIGAAQPNVNGQKLATVKIPLPPLPEQTRIVAKLDALFERIDKAIALLEENIRKTEELMEAVLGEVFGALETNHLFKNFGDLVKNLDGKRIPIKSSQRQTENGTYPYYGASGIIDYVDDFIFEGENLLISEDGANLVVRKYPIAFLATGKYWVNNHAHIVCAKPQITSNSFLAWYFAFKDISGFITGSAQPKLSQQKLNVIPLAIPSLEIQEKILAYLEKVKENQDALQKAQIQKLQSLKSLKSSLLDQAFRGEL